MAKVYDCGLIIGRFNILTVGHEYLINRALEVCDRVIILIGSSNEMGTERNPYNVITREKMLRAIYDDDNRVMIHCIPDLTNENDNCYEWGEYLLKNVDRYIFKEPDCMIYGLSKEEGGRATDWFDDEKLEDMNFLLVPRGAVPISATMVRDMMVRDDRREWQKWVNPRLHKMYDELRSELMTVPYYREKELEYKREQATNR